MEYLCLLMSYNDIQKVWKDIDYCNLNKNSFSSEYNDINGKYEPDVT